MLYALTVLLLLSILVWEISPAAPSVIMMAQLAWVLLHPEFAKLWKKFISSPVHWLGTLIFFSALLPGLYDSNTAGWLSKVQIRLPFLVMPLVFTALHPLSVKAYRGIFAVLIGMMLLAATGVIINYYTHADEIHAMLNVSGHIPTPIHHIRFSLLLALAALASLVFSAEQFRFKFSWEPWLWLLLGLAQVLMLHILSVRSGLLAFYVALLALALRMIILHRRWYLGTALILLMVSGPIIAYHTVYSFWFKVHMTLHNINEYRAGRIGEYSDTQRLLSYELGMRLARQSPWIGMGQGDFELALHNIYAQEYPQQKPMLPHNQFLYLFASLGLLGLLCFVLPFYYLCLAQQRWKEPLLLAFAASSTASFMTETTLETAVGTLFVVFFLQLGLAASTAPTLKPK